MTRPSYIPLAGTSDNISTTCPHCGDRIAGRDLDLDIDPPDGTVHWYPSLLSRDEWARLKQRGAQP